MVDRARDKGAVSADPPSVLQRCGDHVLEHCLVTMPADARAWHRFVNNDPLQSHRRAQEMAGFPGEEAALRMFPTRIVI